MLEFPQAESQQLHLHPASTRQSEGFRLPWDPRGLLWRNSRPKEWKWVNGLEQVPTDAAGRHRDWWTETDRPWWETCSFPHSFVQEPLTQGVHYPHLTPKKSGSCVPLPPCFIVSWDDKVESHFRNATCWTSPGGARVGLSLECFGEAPTNRGLGLKSGETWVPSRVLSDLTETSPFRRTPPGHTRPSLPLLVPSTPQTWDLLHSGCCWPPLTPRDISRTPSMRTKMTCLGMPEILWR